MKTNLILLVLLFCNNIVFSKNINPKMVVYCIPGQGADHRLFNNFDLGDEYKIRFIKYEIPEKGERMEHYAKRLAQQIDTTQSFILIGTSLGGMLATEMTEFLQPKQTIIISSAKSRQELPFRYRFQKAIPFYKMVSGKMMKSGAKFMQPLVEPDRDKEADTFKNMLDAKDPKFMKRSVEMIINWERKTYDKNIIHIHGNDDRTIPIRNVEYDYLIEGGSHMITLTRGWELSNLIRDIME